MNYLKKIINGLVQRRSKDRYMYGEMKSFIAQLREKNTRKKVIKRMEEKKREQRKRLSNLPFLSSTFERKMHIYVYALQNK